MWLCLMRQEIASGVGKKKALPDMLRQCLEFFLQEILNDSDVGGGRPFLTLLNFEIYPITLA